MGVILLCSLLVLTTEGFLPGQTQKPCSTEEAIRAETEASSLQSWAEVYKSYKKFAHCDDGAIAEGYSDVIASLLSDHWNSTDDLARLVSRDKRFEKFVMRHIDELMSPTQAKNIRKNAEAHCPSGAKQLCGNIIAEIRKTGP